MKIEGDKAYAFRVLAWKTYWYIKHKALCEYQYGCGLDQTCTCGAKELDTALYKYRDFSSMDIFAPIETDEAISTLNVVEKAMPFFQHRMMCQPCMCGLQEFKASMIIITKTLRKHVRAE